MGWCCPLRLAPYTHFRCAYGFLHPQTRISVRLLGPCFKTGQLKLFRQNRNAPSGPAVTFDWSSQKGDFTRGVSHSRTSFCPLIWKSRTAAAAARASLLRTDANETTTKRQTPYQCISSTASFSTISSLLTPFSRFFSSFLRSTCSLSVSHKYLALEEVYLPISAEVPINATLRNHAYSWPIAEYGSITLYAVSFQRLLRLSCFPRDSLTYNSTKFPPRIFILSFCRFARRYWGNPC